LGLILDDEQLIEATAPIFEGLYQGARAARRIG
jgi:hypothetical protein